MTRRQATLALVVTVSIWGLSFPALKLLFEDVSPLLAVGLRFGLAALVLAPTLRGLTREDLEAGAVIGGLFAGGVALQNLGLEITTPSRSAFLVSMSALLTPPVAALVLRHRLRADLVLRLVLAIAGVFLLTAPTGSLSDVNSGDWLTMGSALLYAGEIVAVGHYVGRISIPRVLGLKFAATSLAGWGGMVAVETPRLEPTPAAVALLVFLLCSSLLTFTLQFRAQRVVSPSEAALIFTAEPVVAAALSFLIFGERLVAVQLVGCAIILLAVGWPRRPGPGLRSVSPAGGAEGALPIQRRATPGP